MSQRSRLRADHARVASYADPIDAALRAQSPARIVHGLTVGHRLIAHPAATPVKGYSIPLRPPRRSRRRSLPIRILAWAVALLVGYYMLCVLGMVLLRFVPPPTTGVQMQRRVESWFSGAEYHKVRHRVALDDLPSHVPRAIAAAEDGRFWDHHGFDWIEMSNARREAAAGRRIRGASTITQQLMKNLFGSTHRNPIRKVYDLALTPAAELILGKDRILELYLNQVEWGDGVWGIEAAAQHHYGVAATRLSRTQAAGLAALLPNPRQRTPANTAQYRASILRRMNARGW